MSIIKLNHASGRDDPDLRKQYRYAVYEHKLVFDRTNAYTRSFIVLKNKYDVIVHFTCYHNYIEAYAKGICVPLTGDAKAKMHYVCSMLNHILIENCETFGVSHIFGIEKRMFDVFFQDYALAKKPDGSYRSRQAIEKCVATVTGFFRKLCRSFEGYLKITQKDLYDEKTIFTRRGKLQKKLEPNFKVRTIASPKIIFRDIPTKMRWYKERTSATCISGVSPGVLQGI